MDNVVDYLQEQAANGALILALELTDQSTSLLSYSLPQSVVLGQQPVVVVPGGETAGIAPEVLQACHHSIHLPMHGSNTSMNVAVATGAAVYLLLDQLSR